MVRRARVLLSSRLGADVHMQKLNPQQKKVYGFILSHRGCTTKDIEAEPKDGGTGIQCSSGRIAEMRGMGIKIISIGKRKYPGTKAFELYAIEGAEPAYRTVYELNRATGDMRPVRVPLSAN